MELETLKIGLIKFESEDVFRLPSGLYGFPEEREFVLYRSENVEPFVWFQSLATKELAFLLIDPRLIRPEYRVERHRKDLADLKIADGDELAVMTIVSIPEDPKRMTANFQGPLVFNLTQRLVQQVIVDGAELRTAVFAPVGA